MVTWLSSLSTFFTSSSLDSAAAAASGAGEIDLVVDKGTADALFLYADPAPAIDAYLAQVSALLRRGTRSHGLFLVVSCARVDGILTGHGKPLLLEHIDRRRPQLRERNAAFVCLEHRELEVENLRTTLVANCVGIQVQRSYPVQPHGIPNDLAKRQCPSIFHHIS